MDVEDKLICDSTEANYAWIVDEWTVAVLDML